MRCSPVTSCPKPPRVPDPSPAAARRVLVIGGAGVFGARLVAGLLARTELHVIVAGRNPRRLPTATSRLSPLLLDVATVTAESLAATGAFLVADAAGPYQGSSYRLARAAIAAGLHYVDLADARDFVAGFPALHAAASAAGIVALTGASSTPALSNAVLDELTQGWRRVDHIDIAISPGNRAPRGLSVIRSILSYAGRPVRVFTAGAWADMPGWGMLIRRDLPALGPRFLSLAETPDLDIVPRRLRVTDTALFRAGLELPALHLGLWLASLLVRARLLSSLAPMARPVRTLAAAFTPFGTDRGGMLVEATGLDAQGTAMRATWSLLAEAGDGPAIPTLPALAAIRALADGRLRTPGAFACAGILPLDDIQAEFAPHRITTQIRTQPAPPALYARILGAAFASLPAPIQHVHNPGWGSRLAGTAMVEGPGSKLAHLVAAIFRFPPAGQAVPITVRITPCAEGETWRRDFAGKRFTSVLSARDRPGHISERFGLLTFHLRLHTGPTGITGMPVTAWRCGPFPMPLFLAPTSIVSESADEAGRFRFDVALYLPFGLGRLVRYRGWLTPKI